MTTLLVLYRRPDGGPDALAEFERRYAVGAPAARRPDAGAPRRRASSGSRRRSAARRTSPSSPRWTSTTARRSTPGLASDPMRAAGRNLREIAPGLATFLVVEDAALTSPGDRTRRIRGSPGMDTVWTTEEQ